MKGKNFYYIFITLAFVIMATFNACKPEPEPEPNTPGSVTVITNSVSDITDTSAKCGGTVASSGYSVGSCGLCYSELPNPTVSSYITSDQIGTGTFTSTISGLEPETKYYVRAYASTGSEILYGEQKEFTTIKIGAPTITTSDVTEITTLSATCGGVVISDGNAPITERGICWNISSEPTLDNYKIISSGGTGSFTSTMTNLSDNTTYYVRAYATNERGTSYGEEKSFKTLKINTPIVTTSDITNIEDNSAICGGNVISDGAGTVTKRGVCWSTSKNPTITDNHTVDGSGMGEFSSNLNNLAYNTIYYVRAYATNEKGTKYGEEKSFRTNNHDGSINGHEYVDLGLPSGLKWATCNVGASSPEDYGNYYAWGEIVPKETYAIYNCSTYGIHLYNISGDAQYDAATANWGSTWKMPTKYDLSELLNNCTFEWTNMNGIEGYKVVGPNGRNIFLPATGYRKGSWLYDENKNGNYWCSSPATDEKAYFLSFSNNNENNNNDFNRSYGLTIRPISE